MTTLLPVPQNHSQRFSLHNEVHARAPIALKLPVRASYLALMLSGEEKKQEYKHLASLCERFGVSPPQSDSTHFGARFDSFQIRWEQHAEYSSYTFYVGGTSQTPFVEPALKSVPVDWMSDLPGTTIVASHAAIIPEQNIPSGIETISSHFANNAVIGAEMTGGAASAFTDFRIHIDGFSRFLILDKSLKSEQAGRLIQRLFEIEVYRVMALLAFPIAKQLAPELNKTDKHLFSITTAMAQSGSNDAELLDKVTTLAASV